MDVKYYKKGRCGYCGVPSKVSPCHYCEKEMVRRRKKKYKTLAWELTELNDLTLLKNHEKRHLYDHHLDHIVPIDYGFKNNYPVELISSIDNLRFIPAEINLEKNTKLVTESLILIAKWTKQGLI